MQRRTDTSRGRDVDAERPQRAGRVVIRAGDEVGLELRVQLEVGVAEPVHPDHPPVVVPIEVHQAGDGRDANEEDHEEGENCDRDERRAEMVGLRHERQRDHSARQDGKEHVHRAEGLGVSQRASCEQAPVLGGEDLQLSRRRFGGSLHYLSPEVTCIVRPFI